jgi:lipooligosaccharide transport system permease protein
VALGRPLLLGRWPDAPLLHVAVLFAYGVAGFLLALHMFRRRLAN